MGPRPCEPDIRATPFGYLAATPRDHPYRVGVVGEDRDEARRRFGYAMEAWNELHERRAAETSTGLE